MSENRLFLGDNLPILREHIPDESIDLIYLDPPFNSSREYRALPGNKDSKLLSDQDMVFEDTWRWNRKSSEAYKEIVEGSCEKLSKFITSVKQYTGESNILSYMVMMAPRLEELHRVLKRNGSIYLHCDQHASAYLKILMDVIFGPDNFLNCIVWCYGLGGSSPRYWPRKHDDILWYSRVPNEHYFEAVRIPATSQKMKGQFKKAPDFWDIPTINNMAGERLGYPTQKPEALMERIILSSSRNGDTVLDPFCGSGTTLYVAQRSGRKWIGIDSSEKAIGLVRARLEKLSE